MEGMMFDGLGRTGFSLCFFAMLAAAPAPAAEPIKIGFNAPLTGFAAADGASARSGAEIAIEQINAAGGVNGRPLQLVIYDDQGSPKNSVPIATKLIEQDGVKLAISGSYSGATRAAAELFQTAGIPYITAYAVDPTITEVGNFNFRTFTMGSVEGKAGAKLIADTLKLKRVALLTLRNDFGQSLAGGFKEGAAKLGLTIVNEYEYGLNDRQFGPIVAKLKADAPDAIYATGYYFTGGPLVNQIRAGGITIPIVGQAGFDSDKFIEIAGPAAEGVLITTSLNRESKDASVQKFLTDFQARTKTRADMVAASAHAAVNVAAAALKQAGPDDSKKIREAIAGVDMPTVVGRVKFNSRGELVHDVEVQVVKNGSYVSQGVVSDPILLAPPERK
jgi:branched-chain amino acid transport system substrate-binding protein